MFKKYVGKIKIIDHKRLFTDFLKEKQNIKKYKKKSLK